MMYAPTFDFESSEVNRLTYFYVNFLTFLSIVLITKAKVEADEAAALAKKNRESATKTLVSSLEAAIAASDMGIATTLDGLSIGKTAAKKEWKLMLTNLKSYHPLIQVRNYSSITFLMSSVWHTRDAITANNILVFVSNKRVM